MPYQTRLCIAGIRFNISTPDNIRLTAPDDPYTAFIDPDNSVPVAREVTVDVQIGAIPTPDPHTRIFNSGIGWSLHQMDSGSLFVFDPEATGRPLWIAKVRKDWSQITVFCSDALVQKQPDHRTLFNPVAYPLDQILMIYLLSRIDGAIVHAAGLQINHESVIFAGKSGAGKSTLTRLMADPTKYRWLSDDRMVVRNLSGKFQAFGTPWPGEARIAVNTGLPMIGIFFLNQSHENHIKPLHHQEAVERLLPVTSIPWYDPAVFPEILQSCESLIQKVPAYELSFQPKETVGDVISQWVLKALD